MARDDAEVEFDNDKDLDEVWPQVLHKYEQITKQKLDTNTDFRGLQDTIDRKLRDSRSKNNGNARKIMSKLGLCLQQFGSIIAQGTSTVFGPSTQCWNAINFVITAAQGYGHILDGFITLMERSLAFLQRLNIFLEQESGKVGSYLPVHLRKDAYAVLSHFLIVLGSSYKLATSKKEKFKIMLEIVLFSEDDGVKESLEQMESKIQDFTKAQVDQILVDVQGLARYLQSSEEERVRHKSEIQEHLEHIYEISEEVLNVTQEMKITLDGRITQERNKEDLDKIWKALGLQKSDEPWSKRHDHICKVRVKDSGKWLERPDLGFVQWADVREHKTKVLILKGGSGFGKTYASNYIITYLQQKHRNISNPDRASVAYYYYYGEDKDESVERCLGSIVYQLASANPGYANAVAAVCGQQASIARAEDRWDRLFLRLRHAMKGTYFICVDGFDGRDQTGNAAATMSAIARYAMSDVKGVRIRFFISGTNEALSDIPQDDEAVCNILLGRRTDLGKRGVRVGDEEGDDSLSTPLVNASDLEAVAQARVKEIGKKKPDLKAILTTSNIEKLVTGVDGNYEHLEAKMTQINACDTEQKVQDVIDSAGDDLNTSLGNSVRALNASLSLEQIRLLNEILIWIGGNGNPSVNFLQSALYFAFGEKFMLRSLVATTFSTVLTLDDYGGIKLLSDQILQVLSSKEQNASELALVGSPTMEINQAEIELCRRFIRNACGEYDYERFNFEGFFNALAGKQKAQIHVEDEDARNVVITRSSVKVLCERQDDANLKEFREFASLWFYEYMKSFVDRLDDFDADRQSLTDIGSKLVSVLYDPEPIDAWFVEANLQWLKQDWVMKDDFLDPLLKLLKNRHVALGYALDAEKNEWVKSVIAEKASKYTVLGRVAARIATKWFSYMTKPNPHYFWIPYGIFAKERFGNFDENIPPSLAQVDDFIQWAKEHTSLDTMDPCWTFRVGTAYFISQHYEEALLKFKEAESHLPNHWNLLMAVAQSHRKLKDFRSALVYTQKVEALRKQLIESDEEYKNDYWENVLLQEGDCYRQLKEYESAIKCFRNLLKQDVGAESWPGSVHARALSQLFALWDDMKAYNSIIEFLREWRDAEDADRDLSHWFGKTTHDDGIHGRIITAAKQMGLVEEVCEIYSQAVNRMSVGANADEQEKERTNEAKGQLRYYQAAIMFHGCRSDHDHEQALQSWEELIQKSSDSFQSWWLAYKAYHGVARALLDKAAAMVSDSSSSSKSESYGRRLEALSRMNHQVIRDNRQSQKDPLLCLARLRVIEGKHKVAHEEVTSLLRGVFDHWPEDTNDQSLAKRFGNLGQILAVLDDDKNAVAAWQATKPRQSQRSCAKDAPTSDATQNADNKSDQAAQATADAAELGSSLAPTHLDPNDDKPKAYLSDYYCDGLCGTEWKEMLADCWVCKHCLCVQLCAGCYQKLQAGDLHPLVCDKEHKFLYLPPFDHALWARTTPDMMIVGGDMIPRKQWLDQLRDDMGVQQEQIDNYKLEKARRLKATLCLATYISRWRRRGLKKKAQ